MSSRPRNILAQQSEITAADITTALGYTPPLSWRVAYHQILPAELQTLFETPKVLIPAPGAGKFLLVHKIIAQQITQTVDYPTGEGGTITVVYDNVSFTSIASIGSLRQGASFPESWVMSPNITALAGRFEQLFEDKAIKLRTTADITANGDTYLSLKIFYEIIDFDF